MTEREAAIEYLTARYQEQCKRFPRTHEIPLALYLRRNIPTMIANWHNMAARGIYAAKFLKNTGQFTGAGPLRRGTFASYWPKDDKFARVHWDDFDYVESAKQWDTDYADDAKANGQLVLAVNIAKVGSPRFALNDL